MIGINASKLLLRLSALALALLLVVPTIASARAEEVEEGQESPPERVDIREFEHMIKDRTDVAPTGPAAAAPAAPASVLSLAWGPMGPEPITNEYWSDGFSSGRVCCVLPHPIIANVIYIAAAQGGVWMTPNGGGSWAPLTDGLSSLSSGWLAFEPGNPSVLYYATGEQNFSGDSFYGDGLFKTTDGGSSWTKIALATDVGRYCARVLVDPNDVSRIYIASDRGVARSTDGGSTWDNPLSADWCTDLVMDPGNSQTLFAAIYGSGVWQSVDGGDNWTLLAGGLPAAGFQRINLAIAPSNGQRVFASLVDPSGGLLGMYRTDDGGTTWSLLGATPNYCRTQGWYDNTLAVDPSNANVCYAGGVFPYGVGDTGVIKTVDGGTSWTDITTWNGGNNRVHPDQHSLAFGSDGRLWLGNDGGVFVTANGGASWSNCNGNLSITQFYKIGLHPQDGSQAIGGTQDNGTVRWIGIGAWPSLVSGDGGPCGYDWEDGSYSYSTYVYQTQLLRWRNGNAYEGDKTGPWPGLGDRASFCNGPITFDTNSQKTLLVGTHRVWRSSDRGDNWTAISGDLTSGSGWLNSIATCPGAPNTIYAGGNEGLIYQTSDAVVWNYRTTIPGVVRDIVVPPGQPATAYAIGFVPTGSRVWKTINSGAAWSDITGDLPANVGPMSMIIDFYSVPNTIYIGTDYGVYTSTNGGAHWAKDSGGLPNCAVYDMQIDRVRGWVVAATHGRGAWRAAIAINPVGVGTAPDVEGGVGLLSIAPNPATAPVTVEYRLAAPGAARLEVFDLSGRRVATIESGVRTAGAHQVRWDGRDASGHSVTGGIYFLHLQSGGVKATRRIALLMP